MSTLFLLREGFGKRWQLKINDNWFLYEFRLEKDVKRISIDNSILCETITISNERTSPLSGRKNKATNDCQRLWDVVGVRHVHVVRGEERLWMNVAGGCGVQPTDKHHHLHRHRTRTTDDDGRACIYVIILAMRCKLNAQQFTSPTIQVAVACGGGRASTWGCKRRLTFSISPHRTKCTNQQRHGTTDTILSYKIIGPYAYTYYYKIYIVL